jgi:site-specific recombinase
LIGVKTSLSAQPLVELIRSLAASREGVAGLVEGLGEHPERGEALVSYLMGLSSTRRLVHPLAEAGILGTDGFLSGFMRRLTQRVLPSAHPGQNLEEMLRYIFARKTERRWLFAADGTQLARVLRLADAEGRLQDAIRSSESLQISLRLLSYRIASLGLESELADRLTHLDDARTPFVGLVESVEDAIRGSATPELVEAVDEMLRACTREVRLLRMRGATHGTSLRMTMLTTRLLQQIRRARLLLHCLASDDDVYQAASDLGLEVARGAHTDLRVAPYLHDTTRLVAFYLSHHSAERGEHYIAHGRLGWRNLLLAALLGGVWVAPFALAKLGLGKLPAAPLWMGLLFGINYALCFMGMSITGAALATKQPAVTAAATARAMETDRHSMKRLAAFVVRVCRSQFASFVGNLSAAIPLAFVLVIGLTIVAAPPMDGQKAEAILRDLDPLDGGEIVYAAIAGLCLSLSGLIAAYVDNTMLFARFANRLRWQRFVRRRLSPEARERLVAFVTAKGGVLMGNLSLGLMLGAAPILGEFTGLGVDIRHVAFSSAQLGGAIAVVGFASGKLVAWAFVGVFVIGTVNFVVSFGLTLATAMYAQRVRVREGHPLLRELAHHLWRRPQDFFFPPLDEPVREEVQEAPPSHRRRGTRTSGRWTRR